MVPLFLSPHFPLMHYSFILIFPLSLFPFLSPPQPIFVFPSSPFLFLLYFNSPLLNPSFFPSTLPFPPSLPLSHLLTPFLPAFPPARLTPHLLFPSSSISTHSPSPLYGPLSFLPSPSSPFHSLLTCISTCSANPSLAFSLSPPFVAPLSPFPSCHDCTPSFTAPLNFPDSPSRVPLSVSPRLALFSFMWSSPHASPLPLRHHIPQSLLSPLPPPRPPLCSQSPCFPSFLRSPQCSTCLPSASLSSLPSATLRCSLSPSSPLRTYSFPSHQPPSSRSSPLLPLSFPSGHLQVL